MNRLKELRKEKKLSQKDIADYLGINEKTISRWENGESTIKSDKAQALADHFGVSVGYLLGYTDISKQYEDEVIQKLDFTHPKTGDDVVVYSLKRIEDEEFNAFIAFLKSINVVLSDVQIKIVFDLIQSMNIENENTYLGRLIAYDLMLSRDVDELYNEMAQQGYSLLIEDTSKSD